MKTIFSVIILLVGLVLSSDTMAQTTTTIEFDTIHWVLPDHAQIVDFEGEQALMVERSAEVFSRGTLAYLKEHDFSDGIIEFDLYCPQREYIFIGFCFRLTTYREENRYELFFFRPFIVNATGTVQYMPVNNGIIHLSTYEDATYQGAGDILPNTWNHVRAEIEGPHAEVYVNDQKVMTVPRLGRGLSEGSPGVWVGETSPKCYFANFTITE